MDILLLTKVIGVVVTVAILSLLLGRVYQDAQWTRLFRILRTEEALQPAVKRSFWASYVERVETHARILDAPFDRRTLLLTLTWLTGVLSVVGLVMHYALPVAVFIAVLGALAILYWHYARRARKRVEDLTYSFLNEAVPVALHVLEASRRLDLAVDRMVHLVRFAPLKKRLLQWQHMITQPQYESAEAAFFAWATELSIPEITFFALSTREAKRYGVELTDLWVDMGDILGKDLEYRRSIRSRTSNHRQGGYIFYGMLAGTLLLTYPFTGKYMSGLTQFAFWVVICIMTAGLYGIVRESQTIDV